MQRQTNLKIKNAAFETNWCAMLMCDYPVSLAHGTLTLADEEWQPVPWVQAKQYTGHNIIAAVSGNTYYITLTDVGRPGKTGMEETVDTPHNCLYTGHLYNSSFQAMISLCPLVVWNHIHCTILFRIIWTYLCSDDLVCCNIGI